MLDNYMNEQKIAYKIFKNAIIKNKISHAYLIETNNYEKQHDFALSVAKMLMCPSHYSNNEKCKNCFQCQNIDKEIYTELKIINPDGLWIKKDQLDELQKEFSTISISSNQRVYIIEQADKLNTQAANSILKFLEEPSPNITAILLTDNMYKMLNTIVSRCQIIKLSKKQNIDTKNEIEILKNKIQINVSDENLKKIIDISIQFINFYENNHLDTILKMQKLWHNNVKEKTDIQLGLQIMILFYKDVINYKVKENVEIFFNYMDEIKKVANKNNIKKISKKIDKLNISKEKINYNINSSLLMDKLIIELERCD